MEAELVGSGRFLRIEMRGGRSGQARAVTVGFVGGAEVGDRPAVDAADRPTSLYVAAGGPETAWAANLLAAPACRVTLADRSYDAVAELLDPDEHARTIRALILRYGTPAEGLGHGPSFRLRPVDRGAP